MPGRLSRIIQEGQRKVQWILFIHSFSTHGFDPQVLNLCSEPMGSESMGGGPPEEVTSRRSFELWGGHIWLIRTSENKVDCGFHYPWFLAPVGVPETEPSWMLRTDLHREARFTTGTAIIGTGIGKGGGEDQSQGHTVLAERDEAQEWGLNAERAPFGDTEDEFGHMKGSHHPGASQTAGSCIWSNSGKLATASPRAVKDWSQ